MARTRSAKEAGIDPTTDLQEAETLLHSELEEFTRAGGGEPSASLKRILDRASELFPIPRDDEASSSGRGGSGQTCRHTCEGHEEVMDPSRWGKLSNDILIQIFARLPLSQIVGLQVLSQSWKAQFAHYFQNGDPPHSDFLQVCDEVHPKFALITRDHTNKFWVRVLDVKFNTWHAFQIVAGDGLAVDISATSEDGGLVCFISSLKKSKREPKCRTFLIDVVNPLTQQSCALPPLNNFSIVHMVQIMVNPRTKTYKVLVVGEASSGNMIARVYSDKSVSTERWMAPAKQNSFAFGYGYHWGNFRYSQKRDSPCVYDFSAKRLRVLKEGSPLDTAGVKNFALQGDRLYVLRKGRDGPHDEANPNYYRSSVHYILEFRAKLGEEEEWVQIKSHLCKPFANPPRAKYDLSLFACKGFLMVLARLPEEEPYRNEVGWMYNLATCQWTELPQLPGEKPYHVDDLMCRLHWNISL